MFLGTFALYSPRHLKLEFELNFYFSSYLSHAQRLAQENKNKQTNRRNDIISTHTSAVPAKPSPHRSLSDLVETALPRLLPETRVLSALVPLLIWTDCSCYRFVSRRIYLRQSSLFKPWLCLLKSFTFPVSLETTVGFWQRVVMWWQNLCSAP